MSALANLSRAQRHALGAGATVAFYGVLAGAAHVPRFGEYSAVFLGVLVPSIIVHEVSHGLVAYAFGDDTAARAGRLSLNPIAHVDPVGSLVVPALMVLSGHGAGGWARPVPVNTSRLRNPRVHSLFVSIVGPVSNIVMSAVAALVMAKLGLDAIGYGAPFQYWPLWVQAVFAFGVANALLALFNLLPIPPLDGSALVEWFLPPAARARYLAFRRNAFIFLLLLLLVGSRRLGPFFDWAIREWLHLVNVLAG